MLQPGEVFCLFMQSLQTNNNKTHVNIYYNVFASNMTIICYNYYCVFYWDMKCQENTDTL